MGRFRKRMADKFPVFTPPRLIARFDVANEVARRSVADRDGHPCRPRRQLKLNPVGEALVRKLNIVEMNINIGGREQLKKPRPREQQRLRNDHGCHDQRSGTVCNGAFFSIHAFAARARPASLNAIFVIGTAAGSSRSRDVAVGFFRLARRLSIRYTASRTLWRNETRIHAASGQRGSAVSRVCARIRPRSIVSETTCSVAPTTPAPDARARVTASSPGNSGSKEGCKLNVGNSEKTSAVTSRQNSSRT